MASDGSIVIDVKMNVSKAEKDFNKLKKKIADGERELSHLEELRAAKNATASNLKEEIKMRKETLAAMKKLLSVQTEYDKKVRAVESAEAEYQKAVNLYESTLKRKQAHPNEPNWEAALQNTAERVRRLYSELEKLYNERDALAARGRGLQADVGLDADAGVNQEIIQAQKAEIEEIEEVWKRADNAVHGYDRKIENAAWNLNNQKADAGALAENIATANAPTAKLGRRMDEAGSYVDKLGKKIQGLMSRIFVFTLITQALKALKEWLGKAIKTNAEASQAMARLKGALLTLVQPLVNIIIPAFTALVNVLTRIVTVVASVVSMLFGSTAEESSKAAQALDDETKALDGTGKAAKKAGKQLAAFDTLNQIGNGSSGSGGGSSSGTKPDFSQVKSGIDTIYASLVGAAAALVIGAILTFTGANIPLGIGLMAVGAIVLGSAIAENWGAINGPIKEALTKVLVGLAAFSIVIGLILALSGVKLPLGIALIAIGATSLVSAIGMNWDALRTEIQGTLGVIMALVGGAFIAIGLMLALSGTAVGIGLGLIAAGAVTLGTAVAVNWDAIKGFVQENITTILAIVGAALLVIGAILTFGVPTAMPLGIGLLLAGAASLGAAATLNWGAMKEKVGSAMSGLEGLFIGVGVALVVLGLILLFSGVGIPLGLGLLAAGGLSLAAAIVPNWDDFSGTLIGKIKEIMEWFSKIKERINEAKAALLDFFKAGSSENQNMIIRNTPGLTAAQRTSTMPKIANTQIPALAKGAVIPPNREFMAVLGDQKSGTNIEAPAALIEQMVISGLRKAGVSGGNGDGTTIIMEVDGQQFAKFVYKYNMQESRRVGVSLVEGR